MKTLVAVITAFLVSAGLLVVSAPANAAYPKSVSTVCFAAGNPVYIKTTTSPKLLFQAKPTAGNAKVAGTVTIKFYKTGTLVRTTKRAYSGGLVNFYLGKLRKGTYKVTASLATPSTSVFRNCSDGAKFVVRR